MGINIIWQNSASNLEFEYKITNFDNKLSVLNLITLKESKSLVLLH
jgi:hypothetical protein